jgi:hypothetical protein
MTALADFRRRGDSAADKLVQAFKAGHGSRGIDELENLLVELFRWPTEDPTQDPPADFIEFIREKQDLPDWFHAEGSWERVARGQALYWKYRRTALVILGCASLPQCYANSEIAGTLIMSGRLASQVRMRLGETGNFLDAVMTTGALQEGDGLFWIRKVRLIHAVMRALIAEDPSRHEARPRTGQVGDVLLRLEWKADREPIDQLEMAFVLLTFSLVVLDGWRSLGIYPRAEECGDYMLAWAAIGHLLGVEAELLAQCRTEQDARSLAQKIRPLQKRRSKEAAEAGRLLSAALVVLLRERVISSLPLTPPASWFRPFMSSLPQSLIRRLVGGPTAHELWVEPAPVLSRIIHWCLIAAGAFGGRATSLFGRQSEMALCQGIGAKIDQEFCQGAPQFRRPAKRMPA